MRPQKRSRIMAFSSTLILALCLSGVNGEAQIAPPTSGGPWEAFRAAADTLMSRPGTPLGNPPSLFDIQRAFEQRLSEGLRARLAGDVDETDAGFDDCRLAAYLAREIYGTTLLAGRLDWALGLSPEWTRKKVDADSLWKLGYAKWRAQEFDEADVPLRQARALFDHIGDTPWSVRADAQLLYQPLAKIPYEAQREGLSIAAEKAEAAGDSNVLAQCLYYQAQQAKFVGDIEAQSELSARLLNLTDAANDSKGGILALHLRGDAVYEEGQLDSSIFYRQRGLEIAERLQDKWGISVHSYALCLTFWYQDDHEQALQYCEQSMEVAGETNRWWEEENAANIIGNIYGGFGRLEKSLAHYRRADSIAVAHDDYVMRCYVTSNMGLRWLESGDREKARPHFERALAIFDSVPPGNQDAWDLKGEPLLHLSRMAWEDGDTTRATQLAQESLDWAYATAPSPVGVYTAAHGLAYYKFARGDLDQADSLYQLSLDTAKEFGSKYFVRQGHAGLAEVAWRRGERDESIAQLDQSIAEIEAMREALGSLEFREQWFASELWSYELMIRHRIEMGEPEEALAYFERMKARELLDLMTGGHVVPSQELSDIEQDEENRLVARIEDLNRRIARDELGLEAEIERAHADYDAFEERLFRLHPGLREQRGKGRPLTPVEARELMERDEATLLYTLGPDHATLIVVTRDDVSGHVLEEAGPAIRSRVQWLNDSIHSRSGSSSRAISGELFRILVGPAADALEDKKRICVVPDGELYSVPFQALVDPESGSYLIEDHPVYVAPSLSALASMREVESQDEPVLLAFGDPHFSREQRPGTLRSELAPLPFSGREVESIADVYRKRAKVVTGPEASESVFKTLAPDYNVIHIASHGLIDDRNPMHSSIAFSEADSVDDGFLEAREVMKMDLHADIVVLSACETARGRVTRGEGVKGLLRSFFVAGVPTVVASLWPVEDESTALLMSEFHRQLRKGKRPADAMAAAQRTLLKSDPRFQDPYYWAGFLVYGDSR